jgi:hypothetical protein
MSEQYYDPDENAPGAKSSTPRPAPAPEPPERPWADSSVVRLPGTPEAAPSRPEPPVPDGHLDPLPIPMAPAGSASAADAVRIGLWGAPRTGKSTYLAALPVAAMQHQRHGRGNWLIGGMSAEANEFLNDGVEALTIDRRFPDTTLGIQTLSWSFQGEEEPGGFRRRGRQVSFVLDVQDASGEVFDRTKPLHQAAVDHLARSQGLIYLFDPLGDANEYSRSMRYFFATVNELNSRMRDTGGHHRGRLPHHVSVCVTKFDHPEIFKPAVEAGYVTQDSTGSRLPRVPAEHAERFFDWVCNDFRGASARTVRDGLAAYFHPERISYYATSAIGFRLNPQHLFDYRNYLNVETVDGVARIVTAPEPINVLEPLIDLERRMRTRGRTGRTR